MATPTKRTEIAGHVVVGVAAALIVPKIVGKGTGAAAAGAVIAVFLHMMLDAPVAKVMASNGIQF